MALYALAGIAGAGAVVVAYRTDWNPLPMLGVLACVLLLVYLPKPVLEAVQSVLVYSVPISPLVLAKQYFGCQDPFGDKTFYGQWSYMNEKGEVQLGRTLIDVLTGRGKNQITTQQVVYNARDKFLEAVEEIRPMFYPVDGSDRRTDFHKLCNPLSHPYWLRLALLPDLCGLNAGGVRRWRLAHATPAYKTDYRNGYGYDTGTSALYFPVSDAPELSRVVKAYEQIKALLQNDVEFNYRRTDGALLIHFVKYGEGGKFRHWISDTELEAHRTEVEATEPGMDELPYEPLPFVGAVHPAGHLATGMLYFGEQYLDKRAGGHWLNIADLTHFLVMGTSGFGKSVFLNQILQGVRYNAAHFDRVLLVDLKGGVELWPYQALGSQFRVVYRLDDLPEVVAQLVGTIEQRLEAMRASGAKMWPGAKTLLVIDEYAQIQLAPETTKEEKQRKQVMLADLNKISMLGRAAGVLIWAQLQKGTTDVMDSSFRANLASQVCFKVPNKLTAAGMFGSTDELMVDPVKLRKGRFILFDAGTGETHYLQARVIGK